MAAWEEVQTAANEKRHELVLTGKAVSSRIETSGLDESIFSLIHLNFLDISSTCLEKLSPSIGKLSNLTNLVLRGNHIKVLPPTIGGLSKLKLLDLSGNKIEDLPTEIGSLNELQTLNINGNQLTACPDLSSLTQLHVLDLSHNQLQSMPEVDSLEHLAQISANGNEITELPSQITELPSLKTLDVSENKLTEIPSQLSECVKMKEFKFGGNKLKDRRLAKMGEQCTTKSVLDYLRNIYVKEQKQSGSKKKDTKKKKKKVAKNDEVDELINKIEVLHFSDENSITVLVSQSVADVRPYIVMCVVKNLDFNATTNMFKRFINLQTKLHDGICEKRQAATIATHDLRLVKCPLRYDAKPPCAISITPLFKMKEVTADRLVGKLRHEAEEFRKEKKRNTFSGVHKYLDLLKGKAYYPVLLDNDGVVLSFPPITNSDVTKISRDTKDILIEVTSSTSLETCKKVMESLLQELLEMGISGVKHEADLGDEASASAAVGESAPQHLVVQQVKVVDTEGSLKVVYPSRIDLQSEAFQTVRE